MGRFTNSQNGVVVSVADDKDDRFAGPLWSAGTDTGGGADDAAPKGNASRDEWATYADSLGVEYAEDAGREDIKAAVSSR